MVGDRGALALEELGPSIAAFLPAEGGPARLLLVRDVAAGVLRTVAGLTDRAVWEGVPEAAFEDGLAADAAPLLAEVAASLRAVRRDPDGHVVLLAWGEGARRTALRAAFDALRPGPPIPFEDVFEAAALAMAVLGVDRRLHAANRAGRALLNGPGPLRGPGGWLDARLEEDARRLDAALRDASRSAVPVTLTLAPRAGAPGLRCEIGRIDRPLNGGGEAARFLLTASPTGGGAPVEALLVERFGLTGAEARLAGHLAAGRDLRAACEAMGVSRHTARKYLQIAFSKMGVRRQADLVRLALRLDGAAAD